ncbi:hypothetical protein ABID14_000209 [Peptoniphilus olsenii]|uniref:Uncharacterized protein n=1 Tax=Peptoniphilus olsenii TaxID=411570 RepID=A0ABV2J743_9FIRM
MSTKKGYDFYIDDLLLPITPAKINTKIKNKNKIVTLLNGEELNLLKKPGLTEFNFEFRVPSEDFPSVKQFISPQIVLNKLEDLKINKKSFQFIILRSQYQENLNNSINKSVTLEDYEIIEDAENGADLIISIFLKQYIPIKTKVINVNADSSKGISSNKGNIAMRNGKQNGSLASKVIHGIKSGVNAFLDKTFGGANAR